MEEEPEAASESKTDTEELELEFNIEEEPEQKQETIETADSEDLLEFELSEIDEINQEKNENKFDESPEAEDIELDFEIDVSDQESLEEDADTDEVETEQLVEEKEEAFSEASIIDNLSNESETSSVESESAIEETEIKEIQSEQDAVEAKEELETAYDASVKSVEKKKINTFVLVLIILVLLAGIAFGTLFMLNRMGVNIPYMSELLKSKVQEDIGNLKISTLYVTSKFVEASKTGKLFVITGKAKNGYSEPRSFIKIAGKLYTKGKKLAKTETVFCGNVLSDLELSNLDIETIKKRLLNRFGDKRTNVKVEPDKLLPFMIVFNELPDNLEEFTIEVLRSSPAAG
ncbi:MAG: DUF3426 domain-containing protein [Desulfobacterales bacterium]|nr:DUF3426 domain-containing protein [Desulfobacterales bacterium]